MRGRTHASMTKGAVSASKRRTTSFQNMGGEVMFHRF
jgi:hypothetical protein